MITYAPHAEIAIPVRENPVVQTAVHRDYLQTRVTMTYKKLWGKLQPDEQVTALLTMAQALEELAGQMRDEASELVEAIVAPVK